MCTSAGSRKFTRLGQGFWINSTRTKKSQDAAQRMATKTMGYYIMEYKKLSRKCAFYAYITTNLGRVPEDIDHGLLKEMKLNIRQSLGRGVGGI